MQIDFAQRILKIGVKDLIGRESGRWDVNFLPNRAELGRELHSRRRKVRESLIEDYHGEYALNVSLSHRGYTVKVLGRIDGLYRSDEGLIVEEFKSVALESFELARLSPYDLPSARLQLGIYLYLLHTMGEFGLIGELVVCSIFEQTQEYVMRVEPFHDEVEQAIRFRLDDLLDELEGKERWFAARRAFAEALPFPHAQMREVQQEILEEVSTTFQKESSLLLEAPTGIGKTAVSLYAGLKHAFTHDLKLFFVTAKTSGQHGAMATLKRIADQGFPIRAIVLTARDKICPQPVVYCHPDYCPYARDYQERVARTQVVTQMLNMGRLEREEFSQFGNDFQLCPFELSLELVTRVDVVICDYNYVFAPNATLRRIFLEQKYDDYLLIIDEAHNLLARSRDYYSPVLSWQATRMLESWGEQRFDALGNRVRQLSLDIQRYFWQHLDEAGLSEVEEGTVECVPDVPQLMAWKGTLELLLLDDPLRRKFQPTQGEEDLLLAYYRQLSAFVEVARQLDHNSTALIDRTADEARLRILCHDASRHLARRLEGFHAVLAMSATFSPPEFYRDLLGFDAETASASYPSPFPPENRGVFILPDVPDRFKERPRSMPIIRRYVETVLEAHPGNYALYLPSFEFMRQLQPLLDFPDYELLVQDPRMDDATRAAVMRKLTMPLTGRGLFRGFKGRLLLAVQGGSFAEGIEWPEGVLNGVMIVAPGLPRMEVDQELHRKYFEENYARGFDYAYLFPGMAKVVQAAGRLIRRPEDRGVIVLMGERFLDPRYSALLPRYWYDKQVQELVPDDLSEALERFWGGARRRDEAG